MLEFISEYDFLLDEVKFLVELRVAIFTKAQITGSIFAVNSRIEEFVAKLVDSWGAHTQAEAGSVED